MRDEYDRAFAATLKTNHFEHSLGEVCRQGSRHLVEHEHVRLDREGAGEVDDSERGEGQAPCQTRQIEVLEPQIVNPMPEGLQWRLGQPKVGPNVKVGDD